MIFEVPIQKLTFFILNLSKTSARVLLVVSKINCDLGLFSCFSPKYALGKHRRYYLHVANHVGIVPSGEKKVKFMNMYSLF